jgi:hypothetical protein
MNEDIHRCLTILNSRKTRHLGDIDDWNGWNSRSNWHHEIVIFSYVRWDVIRNWYMKFSVTVRVDRLTVILMFQILEYNYLHLPFFSIFIEYSRIFSNCLDCISLISGFLVVHSHILLSHNNRITSWSIFRFHSILKLIIIPIRFDSIPFDVISTNIFIQSDSEKLYFFNLRCIKILIIDSIHRESCNNADLLFIFSDNSICNPSIIRSFDHLVLRWFDHSIIR